MADERINKVMKELLFEVAHGLEKGSYGEKIKIGITSQGSEHGIDEIIKGAELAQSKNPDIEVILIGPPTKTKLRIEETTKEERQIHSKMEEMLESKEIHGAVTMHYNFPMGVSTVGRVITPGYGKELIISTTTGATSSDRVEAMVLNAVYGIATAKACGIEKPTVGVLNVDGSKQVERILKNLKENGYPINFAESVRQDGGFVMRGNDLLSGAPDIMVMDTLTGNLMMKIFSAYTTGGSYESLGYGYGPGVGKNLDSIIGIISRASGAPVIAGSIQYMAEVAKGKLIEKRDKEIKLAEKAGLKAQLDELKKSAKQEKEEVKAPPKKPVTEEITGIDILELENAVKVLWREGIYAETGMGCAGPVVLTSPEDLPQAKEYLKNFIS